MRASAAPASVSCTPDPGTALKMAAHHDPEIEKIMKEIPNEISPSELEYGNKIGQGQYGA